MKTKQKFAAFDIDGTLFRSGLYREVVFEMMRRNLLPDKIVKAVSPKISAWKERLHNDAFENFEHTLIEMLSDEIPRIKIADFEAAAQTVLERKGGNVYRYTRELLTRLKADGYFLIAISGSQAELVGPFAEKYGFDTWVGQQWGRDEEYFSGQVTLTHTGKNIILQQLIDQHSLDTKGSYAIGDTNGDVGMFELVENPIAFNPTQELHDKAIRNGWTIVIERKNVIYRLESRGDEYLLA